MKKNILNFCPELKLNNYNSPNVEVIDIEIEGGLCTSNNATHEGTSEEDWEDISS